MINKSRFMLVLQREYMAIVGKKSFIITTFLVPILCIVFGVGMGLMALLNQAENDRVAVIDQSGRFAAALHNTDEYIFETPADYTDANMRSKFEAQAEGDDSAASSPYYAIVVIPADVDSTLQVNVYSSSPTRGSLGDVLSEQISAAVSDARLARYDIPDIDRIIADSKTEVAVRTTTWGEEGEESLTSGEMMSIIGMALSFLTYMFVLSYGAMIMSSVVEDKTNRIVEVVVSSCKPLELMLGKIIGVALVGLTQMALWGVLIGIGYLVVGATGALATISAMPDMAAAAAAGAPTTVPIDKELVDIIQVLMGIKWFTLISMFVIYFIGGYLLYAGLFAAFGSAVDQQSDAGQFMTPLMMIIMFSFVIGQTCMTNPDGTLAEIFSIVPFTSPMVMMTRLPYDVPWWEIAASIAILYGCAIFITWLAARIYRRGILMYGHKSTLADLWRWLR